ncbi:MAG: peptidoglycan DD-metalloendopeptidase family protein [Azospirillaceae bacterium]
MPVMPMRRTADTSLSARFLPGVRRRCLWAALAVMGLPATGMPASAQGVEAGGSFDEGLTAVDEILAYGVADSLMERPYRLGEEHLTLALEEGENLSLLLERGGVPRAQWYVVAEALEEHVDLRRLRPGREFTLTISYEGTETNLDTLETMPDVDTIVIVDRNRDDGTYTARAIPNELEARHFAAEGRIDTSLFADAAEAGVPDAVIMRLIRTYSFNVDFQRDIQPDDGFAILFEQEYFADGTLARNGNILYARLELSGRDMELFRYEDSEGVVDYYNRDGESLRRTLMRTPIDGARLTSGFGLRHHPILGYSRMHRGVDFAAPTGTPIYAAGNGTIDFLGTNSGYGRYIRIRHNGELSTAYAHMSGYAQGLTRGSRVDQGQTIGYVGTSGLSTGPHLHYEVLVDGAQVNPLDLDLPTGRTLEGSELASFQTLVDEVDRQYSAALNASAIQPAAADE